MSIKRKISHFQKKFTNIKNIDKRQKPFFNANDFPPLPSKPNTNTNKQDYSKTMNAWPGKYTTHSTSASTETYLLQSQPNTKEILPTKKKTLISSTFQLKQTKTQKPNPIQDQCQSNWFQWLSNLHLLNSPARIKIYSPPKINIHEVLYNNQEMKFWQKEPEGRNVSWESSRVHNSKNLWKINLSWVHNCREQKDRK